MQIVLVFLLGFFTIVPQDYPEKPNSIVFDQARILNDSVEEDLQDRLNAYRDSTGNHIQVATVNSLDGLTVERYAEGLFDAWSIGHEDLHTGILLLVAPNEGKVRIEVGYGLEGNLEDLNANRIVENEMVPAFKQDNFSKGVEAGVDRIIDNIGDITIEEQGEQRVTVKEESSSLPWRGLLVFMVVVVIGGALAALLYQAYFWYKEYRRARRLVDEKRVEASEVWDQTKGQLKKIADDLSRDRHREFIESLRQDFKSVYEALLKKLNRAESNIDNDPEQAAATIDSISFERLKHITVSEAENRLKEVRRADYAVPHFKEFVEAKLSAAREDVRSAREDGFTVDDTSALLDEVPKLIGEAERALRQEPDQPLYAAEKLADSYELINNARQSISKLRRRHEDNEQKIKKAQKAIDELEAEYNESSDKLLAKLQENVPNDRWRRLEDDLKSFPEKVTSIRKRLGEAKHANNLDVQELARAESLLREVTKGIGNLSDRLSAPRHLLSRVRKAREEIPHLEEDIPEIKAEAEGLMDHDDVEQRARDLFSDACDAEDKAKQALQMSPPDVIAARKSYAEAKENFQEAIEQAEADIEEAKKRRRRRRRNRNTATTTGVSSGVGGSSSVGGTGGSTGGFGGFGGGSSGGAGASGSF